MSPPATSKPPTLGSSSNKLVNHTRRYHGRLIILFVAMLLAFSLLLSIAISLSNMVVPAKETLEETQFSNHPAIKTKTITSNKRETDRTTFSKLDLLVAASERHAQLLKQPWNSSDWKEITNRYQNLQALAPISFIQKNITTTMGNDANLTITISRCPVDYLEQFQDAYKRIPRNLLWSSTRHEKQPSEKSTVFSCDLSKMIGMSQDPLSVNRSPATADKECQVYYFDPQSACELLSHSNLTLLVVGSSLMRYVVRGLGISLSGDAMYGGLEYLPALDTTTGAATLPSLPSVPNTPETASAFFHHRACDRQWHCNKQKLTWEGIFDTPFRYNATTFQNLGNICPDHHGYNIVPIFQYTKLGITPELERLAQVTTKARRRVVILSDASALSHLNAFSASKKLWKQLVQLFQAELLIPMTIHFVGPNKPPEYLGIQGKAQVERYNGKLRGWAANVTTTSHPLLSYIPVLDTYNLTRHQPSPDGVHYPTTDVALAQFVLNFIWRYLPPGVSR